MEYDDLVRIATPEGVELRLVLAGAASRFVSAIVDILIQIVLLIAIGVVLGIAGEAGLGQGGPVAVVLWALLSFLVVWGYDVFFEVFNSGRTPGKRLNGLRVVRIEGHPVTFVTSAIRNLLRPIDFLPSAYLLGAIAILASSKNQRLGDVVAGTIVVRERVGPPDSGAASWGARSEPVARPYASWDTSQITPDEIGAVRAFLARRHSIEPAARSRIALTLENRLRPKIAGAPLDVRGEQFLEALVAVKTGR